MQVGAAALLFWGCFRGYVQELARDYKYLPLRIYKKNANMNV